MATKFISSNRKWKLEWIDLGEGWSGDYDPDDPDDAPLLRADLFVKEKGKWVEPPDSSYCTMARVGTPRKQLQEVSERLFHRLGDGPYYRKDMEHWTWETKP